MQHERIAVVPATGIKLLVGLFLAALGVLWTLQNLGLAETGPILRYWPAVLIAIGVLKLPDASARAFSIVTITTGTLLLLRVVGILKVGFFDLWPVILIAVGARLILLAIGAGPPAMKEGSTIWSVLATQQLNVKDAFTSGRAVAFMGTAKVNLTEAQLGAGAAVLDVFALMGAIEIYVPDGWYVRTEVIPFMAGVETNTRSRIGGKELLVRGFVMMAGVDIKDVTARNA